MREHCVEPCSDAAGTCTESCPHLRRPRRGAEPFIARRIIRRLLRPVQPDVEQERRVRQALYGERRVVERLPTQSELAQRVMHMDNVRR